MSSSVIRLKVSVGAVALFIIPLTVLVLLYALINLSYWSSIKYKYENIERDLSRINEMYYIDEIAHKSLKDDNYDPQKYLNKAIIRENLQPATVKCIATESTYNCKIKWKFTPLLPFDLGFINSDDFSYDKIEQNKFS